MSHWLSDCALEASGSHLQQILAKYDDIARVPIRKNYSKFLAVQLWKETRISGCYADIILVVCLMPMIVVMDLIFDQIILIFSI